MAAWLSVPFWIAHFRSRKLEALAKRHGFTFSQELPQEFPFRLLFPDRDSDSNADDARNIVFGTEGGDQFLSFDLGTAYSRNQRPQTMVARRRMHRPASPPPPPPASFTLRQQDEWLLLFRTSNAFERVFQGALDPAIIERLWTSLA